MNTITKVKTAAGAAWKTFFASWGLTTFTYLAYLAMNAGWLDWLINSGLYGSVTREQMLMITFCYVGVMKLIGLCVLLGALFLSMWWRGLRAAE
jgi:hypothetical protein